LANVILLLISAEVLLSVVYRSTTSIKLTNTKGATRFFSCSQI